MKNSGSDRPAMSVGRAARTCEDLDMGSLCVCRCAWPKKHVENAYHWVAARSHGKWSIGGTMSEGDKGQRLAWNGPVNF